MGRRIKLVNHFVHCVCFDSAVAIGALSIGLLSIPTVAAGPTFGAFFLVMKSYHARWAIAHGIDRG